MEDHHSQASENVYYQTPYRDQMTQLSEHQGTAVVVIESALRPVNGATWGVVVAAYLATDIQSEGTRRAYARHLRNAQALFGVTYVSELTGEDLNDFKAMVVASGLAPASQSQALSALRSFLLWAGSMEKHALPTQMISLALRTPKASVQVRYSVINEMRLRPSCATHRVTGNGQSWPSCLVGAFGWPRQPTSVSRISPKTWMEGSPFSSARGRAARTESCRSVPKWMRFFGCTSWPPGASWEMKVRCSWPMTEG